ncbi:MAG: T9SS type A sorting domain-containing protein [Bacteroidales bacterium]|nr:T9SS type A sorting domain-containing protein [Bacteroidales bacterium]
MKQNYSLGKLLLTAVLGILLSGSLSAQNVITITDNQSYIEDFEGNGFSLWTVDTTGGGNWAKITGTLSSVASFSYQNAGDEARLISPVFDMSNVTEVTLNFSYAMLGLYTQDVLEVAYRTSDTSAWQLLGTLSVSDYTNYFEQTYTLPSLTSTYQISFNGRGLGGLFLFVDNVEVASTSSCARPISLGVEGLTASSALLNWVSTGNESSWIVEFDGQETVVNTHPYMVTGLSPQTEYSFRVKAKCGPDDESEWSTAFPFTTLCDVYVVADESPYYDDFEASDHFLCWQSEIISGTDNWTLDPGYVHPNNTAFFIWLGGEARLESVALDISSVTTPALNFKRKQIQGTTDVDELSVWYRNSPEDEWHSLANYIFPTENWETETLDLPNPSNQYQIAFVGVGNNGEGIYVDDVAVGKKSLVGIAGHSGVMAEAYPNPTTGKALLQTSIQEGEVFLYDMYGKYVSTSVISGGRTEIDLGGCAKGVYAVRLYGDGNTVIVKLVKE